MSQKTLRILIANPGLDVHDVGARYVAQALRDAGMEVIYLGIRQTPEEIVNAAIQESVNIVGLSILSGRHNTIVPQIYGLLKEKGAQDIPILVGGIIPRDDIDTLKTHGVRDIFLPGTPSEVIVNRIKGILGG
jgi:methylmalonyl-CoA mutase C-terminal domain/subunit